MADVGNGVHRIIQDVDGEAATVTSNRLDVNATLTSSDRGVGSGLFTYAQFDAHSSTATIITDSTNGINSSAITDCLEIIIQADYDNSGYIMIGDDEAAADTNGLRLNAGDTLTLPVSTTAVVYIKGSASSQKVNVAIIRQ